MSAATDATDTLDRPPAPAPRATGVALRRADTLLRIALGTTWGVLAFAPGSPALELSPATTVGVRLGLAACGLLALAGRVPRAATGGGLALSALLTPEGAPAVAWIALLGAAAARLAIRVGEGGRWLARVETLETERTFALAATALARSRARAERTPASKQAALTEAGDAYELAGRARSALEALGAEPSRPADAVVRAAAATVGLALRGWGPSAARRLERALIAGSTRRAARRPAS